MHTTAVQSNQLFIEGAWQDAQGGRTFEKTNPFTGQAIARCASAGRAGGVQAGGGA